MHIDSIHIHTNINKQNIELLKACHSYIAVRGGAGLEAGNGGDNADSGQAGEERCGF